MNITPENAELLLRKSPRIAAPPHLLEKLQGDIEVPKANPTRTTTSAAAPSIFRRLLPALSLALWMVACLVVLAVQTATLSQLRMDNEILQAAAAEARQLSASKANANAANDQSSGTHTDELQKLRAEVTQLTAQLKELENIRATNVRLRTEAAQVASNAPPDFFTMAAAKSKSLKCVNNLKQVGLGARMWANDHKDILPPNFQVLKPEYCPDPGIFYCPEDSSEYVLVTPNASETDPWVVLAQCPRHRHVTLCDGSVQQIGNRPLVVRDDGKTVVGK